MASQLDLDQGGTFRQMLNLWMGPSIGWITIPAGNGSILPVAATGTTVINRSTTLVLVTFTAGGVILSLPSALASGAGAGAVPGLSAAIPITIVDSGGNAGTNNHIINPFGSETIDGLSTIKIASNYGAYVLRPGLTAGTWTLLQ